MKTWAILLMVLVTAKALLVPAFLGRAREPFGVKDFYRAFSEAVLVSGVCGRVLGWW